MRSNIALYDLEARHQSLSVGDDLSRPVARFAER